MHIPEYLGLVRNAEQHLASAYKRVAGQHAFEPDVVEMCDKFKKWSEQHLEQLESVTQKFNIQSEDEAEEISEALFSKPRMGGFGMLRDLHGLWMLVHEAQICWIVLFQASQALRDTDMEAVCREAGEHSKRQAMWLLTKIKSAAPQVLVVAE